MTTIHTPGGTIVYADDIRTLSALAYLRFTQAWTRETGLANNQHEIQAHMARHGAFLGAKDAEASIVSFENLIESLNAQEAGEPLLAAVLAPAVQSIGGRACTDLSPSGLETTAWAILESGISQQQLEEAVDNLKKKSSAN